MNEEKNPLIDDDDTDDTSNNETSDGNAFDDDDEREVITGTDEVTIDELAELDDEYQAAETYERRDAPDGSYQVEIERAILKRTKNTQEPMLSWQFRILGPTHEGLCIFKNHFFRPKSLPFLKTDLSIMGVEIAGPSEIPGVLDSLIGLKLNVKQVTKENGKSVYINSMIDDNFSPTVSAGSTGAKGKAKVKF